jgi:GH25 family lysozyme M1 (1,4-beta-N-acetylmuramidase)
MHWGTDFGREGGSAGMPVYAAQAGTVVQTGAASGYGGPSPAGWVRIDHSDEQGGGQTVYGHVIAEVSVGDQVRAGQRIAHINPNSATNGGVAPHLHFEVYPWTFARGEAIDAVPWLAGALEPEQGQQPAPAQQAAPGGIEGFGGTVFGVDVSEHQDGMSLRQAANEGIQFAIIRTTDGTYMDRCYQSHLDDAESAGMVTAAYHYLRNPSEGTTVAQQVDAALAVMGDARRPMWLDCETDAGLSVEHIREAKRLFEAAGVRVCGVYSYVPWWEGRVFEGEPKTEEFGAVWVAAYGRNFGGVPAHIYGGDYHQQWDYPLGDQKPVIWQFGSRGLVAGREVDINAFRGTIDQLKQLFYGGDAPHQNGESVSYIELGGVSAAALNDTKIAVQKKVPSYVDNMTEMEQTQALAFIDAAAWEIREVQDAIARAIGLDPEKIKREAREKLIKKIKGEN